MPPSVALELALTLAEHPDSIEWVSRAPLPSGMTLLLEVAIGELGALNAVQGITTQNHGTLQTAAAIFIQQVLFAQAADSYRVLGVPRTATRKELRRHMALLVKWLHPDRVGSAPDDCNAERRIFFPRVTEAWEDLKNDVRRAAYDRVTAQDRNSLVLCGTTPPTALGSANSAQQLVTLRSQTRPACRRLVIYRVPHDTLFSRLFYYLGWRT